MDRYPFVVRGIYTSAGIGSQESAHKLKHCLPTKRSRINPIIRRVVQSWSTREKAYQSFYKAEAAVGSPVRSDRLPSRSETTLQAIAHAKKRNHSLPLKPMLG